MLHHFLSFRQFKPQKVTFLAQLFQCLFLFLFFWGNNILLIDLQRRDPEPQQVLCERLHLLTADYNIDRKSNAVLFSTVQLRKHHKSGFAGFYCVPRHLWHIQRYVNQFSIHSQKKKVQKLSLGQHLFKIYTLVPYLLSKGEYQQYLNCIFQYLNCKYFYLLKRYCPSDNFCTFCSERDTILHVAVQGSSQRIQKKKKISLF